MATFDPRSSGQSSGRKVPGGAFGGLGPMLILGMVMGVCIALGLLLGLALDRWFNLHPWGVILGTIWGLAAAVVQTVRAIAADERRLQRERDARSNPRSNP